MKTDNPFLNLRAQITGLNVGTPPCRRLLVAIRIENPSDITCALVSSWTEASFTPGGTAADGSLFQQLHAQTMEAVLRARGELLGEFSIPVSAAFLAQVERQRQEGVSFQLRSRFLFAPIQIEKESRIMGAPWEVGIFGQSGSPLGQVISQSDWINLLKRWQWQEIELFELPFDRQRESPIYQRAFELARVAEERLRRGDYTGTFQNCRQALESIAVDTAPDHDLAESVKVLISTRVQGENKRERVNAILMALNKFGHLGRHEIRPHEDLTRRDAVFILRCTLSTIQYLTAD